MLLFFLTGRNVLQQLFPQRSSPCQRGALERSARPALRPAAGRRAGHGRGWGWTRSLRLCGSLACRAGALWQGALGLNTYGRSGQGGMVEVSLRGTFGGAEELLSSGLVSGVKDSGSVLPG